MKILITNIQWDTEGQDDCGLPDNVLVICDAEPEGDELSDLLSDCFSFCHFGFDDIPGNEIRVPPDKYYVYRQNMAVVFLHNTR